MATVKVKFRPSIIPGREGAVYYQVIHQRVVRQIKSSIHLFPEEWDHETDKPRCVSEARMAYINYAIDKIDREMLAMLNIINAYDRHRGSYTADDVVSAYRTPGKKDLTFFAFMRSEARNMARLGKLRTSENYTTTLNSFRRFRNGLDLMPDEVDADLMIEYEAFMQRAGLCRNTTSFYMRNLRAIYNRAIDKGLAIRDNPFRRVYTGVDKTVKRAVSLSVIRNLRRLNLSKSPSMDMARDVFMFSFYTRGMSLIDMSFLRKADLRDGFLTYRRRKTGQRLIIRWEDCMEKIISKYRQEASPYLLPIIIPGRGDERKQYRNAGHATNKWLKIIGRRLEVPIPLTLYCARHAWASIAHSKNVPLPVISEAMGHDSESTTRIYLSSIDTSEVDKANYLIIKSIR